MWHLAAFDRFRGLLSTPRHLGAGSVRPSTALSRVKPEKEREHIVTTHHIAGSDASAWKFRSGERSCTDAHSWGKYILDCGEREAKMEALQQQSKKLWHAAIMWASKWCLQAAGFEERCPVLLRGTQIFLGTTPHCGGPNVIQWRRWNALSCGC